MILSEFQTLILQVISSAVVVGFLFALIIAIFGHDEN